MSKCCCIFLWWSLLYFFKGEKFILSENQRKKKEEGSIFLFSYEAVSLDKLGTATATLEKENKLFKVGYGNFN